MANGSCWYFFGMYGQKETKDVLIEFQLLTIPLKPNVFSTAFAGVIYPM